MDTIASLSASTVVGTGTPTLRRVCTHTPRCASAESAARESARVVARHVEQGWNLLCNGVIAFDDGGDILPSGRIIAPRAYAACPRAPRATFAASA